MLISQFFILSPRGDTVVARDYLGNVPKNAAEVFLRKARAAGAAALPPSSGGVDAVAAAPPLLTVDGVHYLRATHAGLHFVAATRANVSPALALELLARIAGAVRDACGALSEDAVRRNGVLVYELLDEAVDGGLPQPTDPAALRERVVSVPVIVRKGRFGGGGVGGVGAGVGGVGAGAAGGAAPGAPPPVVKSVLADAATGGAPRRDEIFVDVVERVSAVLVAGGGGGGGGGARALRASVDGALRVKAFLSGAPTISVALSEDLIIGKDGASGDGGAVGFGASAGGGRVVRLDDALFHESASLARFDADRALDLAPADGETDVMRYRAGSGLALPFGVGGFALADDGDGRAVLSLALTADFPADRAAAGWTLTLPFPPAVARVSADVAAARGAAGDRGGKRALGRGALAPPPDRGGGGGSSTPAAAAGTADFDETARTLTWRVPSVPGGTTLTLRARLTLAPGVARLSSSARRGVGPATLAFTVPQLSVTGLGVRYLHVSPPGGGAPGGALASPLGGGSGGRGGGGAPARWVRYVTTASAYVVRLG